MCTYPLPTFYANKANEARISHTRFVCDKPENIARRRFTLFLAPSLSISLSSYICVSLGVSLNMYIIIIIRRHATHIYAIIKLTCAYAAGI